MVKLEPRAHGCRSAPRSPRVSFHLFDYTAAIRSTPHNGACLWLRYSQFHLISISLILKHLNELNADVNWLVTVKTRSCNMWLFLVHPESCRCNGVTSVLSTVTVSSQVNVKFLYGVDSQWLKMHHGPRWVKVTGPARKGQETIDPCRFPVIRCHSNLEQYHWLTCSTFLLLFPSSGTAHVLDPLLNVTAPSVPVRL